MPAVTELIGDMDSHFVGQPELTEQDLRDEWEELDLERDAWLVELDEDLAGYVALHTAGQTIVEGHVHPRFFDRGVGSRLVELAETEAQAREMESIRNAVLASDDRARELLTRRGYGAVRHFYRMAIELDSPPPAPNWPLGFTVKPVDYPAEGEEFHATLDEAFAEEWGHEPERDIDWRARRERPGFDPSLWFIVRDGEEVAAAALCDEDRFGAGWIASIGVRRPWRRHGLGRALLLHAFGELYRRGRRRIALGVDAQNPTGATRLYERAGMNVVFRATIFEKPLTR